MTTIRKRIGGGWKNVELTKPDDRGTGIILKDKVGEDNQKHIAERNVDSHMDFNNELENNLARKIKKVDAPEKVNEFRDESEHKLRLDELINEKSSRQRDGSSGEAENGNEFEKQESSYADEVFDGEGTDIIHETDNSLSLPEISSSVSTSEVSEPRTERSQKSKSGTFENYADFPILKRVQDNVIGHDLVIATPYGHRRVTYCDYTASGRSLSFIEDFIRENVIPTYANTHSTTGHNARQTGKYREEARNIIKSCVNASKDDVVVFTGSGATAGMHKVAWALKMNNHRIAAETAVFIGPYEHHSNILLWREFGTKVVRIRHDHDSGMIDLEHLKEELAFWKEKKRHLLVCMSAASNVTGIITDVDAVSEIAHKHKAMAIFDYAGGGPYLKIDMNPSKLKYKDAVIVSPHKFVGGPGTPGVVIAKKWIFKNTVPDRVGGGTVRFVTREQHAYVGNIEEREEGGTPAIIESIRAGLVFQLKQEIGTDLIHARERILARRAFTVWEKNPSIFVLGSHTADRVTIFSFLTIHQETGRLIHHNFISSLLSDLYGIQARGGCACAGPYAQDLMGVSEATAKKYLVFLAERPSWKENSGAPHIQLEIMKPGFTRINLSYFTDDETADFVIQAVDMVTKYGWKLLPQYSFDIESGSWHHKSFANTTAAELMSLQHALNDAGQEGQADPSRKSPSYKQILETAKKTFDEADSLYSRSRISSASLTLREYLPKEKRGLKWFLTPHEAVNILTDSEKLYLERKPFRLPFNLQAPSFLTEQTSHNTHSNTLSLPLISPTRGRNSDNKFDSSLQDNRRYKRQSKHDRNAERLHLPSLRATDDGIHMGKHERRSHEEKMIDLYATPRYEKKAIDDDVWQNDNTHHVMQNRHKKRASRKDGSCESC